MRLIGRVIDAASETPVSEARVVLRIVATEIARLRSDQEGEFEYETNQSHIGDTVTYYAEKQGFTRFESEITISTSETRLDISLSAVPAPPVPEEPGAPEPELKPQEVSPRRRRRLWIAIGIAAAVVVAAILVWIFWPDAPPPEDNYLFEMGRGCSISR